MSEALPLSLKSKDGSLQKGEWEGWITQMRQERGLAGTIEFLEALFRSILCTPEAPEKLLPPLVSGIMHKEANQKHYDVYLPHFRETLKKAMKKAAPKKAAYI